jgi:hypothetical protein
MCLLQHFVFLSFGWESFSSLKRLFSKGSDSIFEGRQLFETLAHGAPQLNAGAQLEASYEMRRAAGNPRLNV